MAKIAKMYWNIMQPLRKHPYGQMKTPMIRTFSSKRYIDRLADSKKNWIGEEIPAVTARLIEFLKSLDL